MSKREFRIQLKDLVTGKAIAISGGVCYVAKNGLPDKETLYNKDGAPLSNPVNINRGGINFLVDEEVTTVDLYIQAPGGQFIVAKDVEASGPNEICVDTGRLDHTLVIPFAIGDTTANTETDTGFTVPNGMMLPTPFVDVKAADSGITLDVGTDSNDSGDADGFIAGISVASAVVAKASLANGAMTLGDDLYVQDSGNAGDEAPEGSVATIGKAITYTLSASADTAKGFIHLPYRLAA